METQPFNPRAHWEQVYETKTPQQVSWTQEDPQPSLDWILGLDLPSNAFVVDSGGGRSVLAEKLVKAGLRNLEVFDISMRSLAKARLDLKSDTARDAISYRVCNVLDYKPEKEIAVWHDRAVFHFLVEVDARNQYVKKLLNWSPEHIILGTFSPDGPSKCSGLPIRQYDAYDLDKLFKPAYHLVKAGLFTHVTPSGREQAFTFVHLERRGP